VAKKKQPEEEERGEVFETCKARKSMEEEGGSMKGKKPKSGDVRANLAGLGLEKKKGQAIARKRRHLGG